MTSLNDIKASKFLSLVLRHEPEAAGVCLDAAGWVAVDDLLAGCGQHGKPIDRDQLERVVATSDKQRFAFNEDRTRIRANQGHSVEVDLQYEPRTPPDILYHGTASRFLDSIREKGLLKMDRHHVHLSAETRVTMQVGARHGRPVLLTIRADQMVQAGYVFYCSTNHVWLTNAVPSEYLVFP